MTSQLMAFLSQGKQRRNIEEIERTDPNMGKSPTDQPSEPVYAESPKLVLYTRCTFTVDVSYLCHKRKFGLNKPL